MTTAQAPMPRLFFGTAYAGYKLFTYAAGTVTKQTTYTDSTGQTPNTNPIILDSLGSCACWFPTGLSMKLTLAPPTDTDPPQNPVFTSDSMIGIGVQPASEWVSVGATPVYVSGTQFTVPGNLTSTLQVNRRVQASVQAGTIYGVITASNYSAPNTSVTVAWDLGQLDSGLSAVNVGFLSAVNVSIPSSAFSTQTATLSNKTILASGSNTVEATSAPSTTPFAFRNKLINGNFDIWQRVTSFASTGYTADRWYCGALSNVTLARGSISDGSATYCLNFTATNATNSSNVYQPIESYTVNTLKGKQVTLSFNITASTGTQTVSYRVRKNATGDTATGGTWSDIGNGTIGATTATQTKSLTVTIPNDGTANGVSVQFDFSNITNGAVISIWAVQLEVGAVATPFETRPYGMELSLCQRYYYRKNAAGGSGVPFCQGFANSTTLMYGWLDFPVPMRVAPAAIEQDGTASDYRIGYAGGATACSAVPAYVAATTFGAMTSFTVASGLTAGQAVLAENAANSPYLGWSAEL